MNDTTRQQIVEILTSAPINGDTHQMEFISDPAHGWLKVPVSAYKLAAAHASRSSYQDGETLDTSAYVYLEEDMDAPRFLQRMEIAERLDYGQQDGDGESWYIPHRDLTLQRRYNERSPRDMNPIHDPDYVSPFTS